MKSDPKRFICQHLHFRFQKYRWRKSIGLKKISVFLDGWFNSLYFGNKGSNELYVAGEAGVFVTKDGGEKWNRFGGEGPGPFAVWTILRDPANGQFMLAGTDRGVFTYALFERSRIRTNTSELRNRTFQTRPRG